MVGLGSYLVGLRTVVLWLTYLLGSLALLFLWPLIFTLGTLKIACMFKSVLDSHLNFCPFFWGQSSWMISKLYIQLGFNHISICSLNVPLACFITPSDSIRIKTSICLHWVFFGRDLWRPRVGCWTAERLEATERVVVTWSCRQDSGPVILRCLWGGVECISQCLSLEIRLCIFGPTSTCHDHSAPLLRHVSPVLLECGSVWKKVNKG